MKVCILALNVQDDNGAGVFTRHLVHGIKEQIDTVVLTSVPGGDMSHFAYLGPHKRDLVKNALRIRACFREADIIHALDLYPFGLIAYILSFGLGRPIIITAVGSGTLISLYSGITRYIARHVFRSVRAVTAISTYTKRKAQTASGRGNIEVITPGVDAEAIRAVASDISPLPYRYMLSVGAIRWRKGYQYSIEAFAKIAEYVPDLHYVIVGRPYSKEMLSRLEQKIEQLHVKDRVHLLTDVNTESALMSWYRHAELFVLLSQNVGHDVEGFGLVFLEAAAFGIPVIGSTECGVEDAVVDGYNGFLIPERDVEACAKIIRNICVNHTLHTQLSGASREWAERNGWNGKIAAYMNIYRSVCANI
ncbi:MAG: glycosyltransferase family 4 protein [Patescibacteria group bacterium]